MGNNAEEIKKIARDVYRALGSGFSEGVYDRAMQVGLRLAKLTYENQKVVELRYKNHYVGQGYPDLVVRLGQMQWDVHSPGFEYRHRVRLHFWVVYYLDYPFLASS